MLSNEQKSKVNQILKIAKMSIDENDLSTASALLSDIAEFIFSKEMRLPEEQFRKLHRDISDVYMNNITQKGELQ